MKRVLIADDSPVFRLGMRHALKGYECGEADSIHTLHLAIHKERWDALIVSSNVQGTSSYDAVTRAKRWIPSMAVLALDDRVDKTGARGASAMRAGAAGYLHRCSTIQTITEALTAILWGEKRLPPSAIDYIVSGESFVRLSAREEQIAQLLSTGLRVGIIAEKLGMSSKTVSTYRVRALSKLGFKDNSELMRHCLERGIV